MKPKISIIVSVYNGANFLNKFFENLTDFSNYSDFEILFINDGSTDCSLEIIKDFIKNKKNMYVYTKKNGGLSSARNFGIEKANGEYIFFSDCDDYFSNDYFKVLKNVIKKDADMYIFNFNQIIDNEIYDSWIKLPKNGYFEFNKNNLIEKYFNGEFNNIVGPSVWNKLYKKDIIVKHKITFIEEKILNEDVFFNIEYFMNTKKVYIENQVIYNYVIHENSITRSYKNWLITAMENNYKLIPSISSKYSYHDFDKYIMKVILPFTLTILRNESNNIFTLGFNNIKNFFSSPEFKKYMHKVDKKVLTKKEKIYSFLINTKFYYIVFLGCFLKTNFKKTI